MKILIADDEPTNRLVTLMMLKRLGHEAHAVSDGVELLRFLEHDRVELVLLDVYMPIMDGIEAAREIVRRWGDLSRPILIALTASDDHRIRQICVAAGIDDYVVKPIQMKTLRDVLSHWPSRAHDPRVAAEAPAW